MTKPKPRPGEYSELDKLSHTGLDPVRYVPSATTLQRIGGLWIAAKQRDGWAHHTTYNHRATLRRMHEILGPVDIAEIDWPHVRRYVAARLQQGKSGHSIDRDIATLAQLLEWCGRQGLVAEVVTRKMRMPELGLPPRKYYRKAKGA